MSNDQISINNLSKVYDNGFEALKNINLNIKKGEIFAMLGPNGAGKTTLISIICGIVRLSTGIIIPKSKLFEKSGAGKIKKPPIKPITIEV